MNLELNKQEQQTLADVLRSSLSELREEVVHTDRLAYRERLKEQEDLLKEILTRLDQE
jgi:hypothetical protein